MQKALSYPITFIYYLFFLPLLGIFHPVQVILLNVFGYQPHKKSVDILNGLIIAVTHVLGTTYKIRGIEKIPVGVPLIIVANHQSMYDIPVIIWFLRKFHPKFISKKELGRGIPSVSYNLRHGGSILIDRKDPKQALPAIKGLAEYIQKHNRAAVIFPEGTRSRTGEPKRFSENGLKILCKFAPSAYIVPVSINNSWKLVRWGQFPLGLGTPLSLNVQEPFAIMGMPFEEVMGRTENAVVQGIHN